jgi:AhpD family alkylhydroperoxidase
MTRRLDHKALAPRSAAALNRLSESVALDRTLRELVNLRASQLNGCRYCIALHTGDARAAGESEERLSAVEAWREAACFTERERAALALCEAVTLVAGTRVPDAVWDEAAGRFEPAELADLLFAIVTINAYNRLAIATRMEPADPPAGAI